jgi:hypothetical protein
MRDTYGIEVAPGQDASLILAIAVCIDRMRHDQLASMRHAARGAEGV